MKKSILMTMIAVLLIAPAGSRPLPGQGVAGWRQDVDALLTLIERHHPRPWQRIDRGEFLRQMTRIKQSLAGWSKETITVELMRLVASLQDGHTALRVGGQRAFLRWFPIRMERFSDGIFVTACDETHAGLLTARVVRIGRLNAEDAFRRVSTVVARDSEQGSSRLTANYLANAIILKVLGIIAHEKELVLETEANNGTRTKSSLPSAFWPGMGDWTANKMAAPTANPVKTIFDGRQGELPLYLARFVASRPPYWFEYVPQDRLLFVQFNQVTDWRKEPFADFSKRLFSAYDEHAGAVDRFVIDLRFNTGGNGHLLTPFIQEFVLRRSSLPRGKLYIITGGRTFSAATNFIGQMLKQTSAITVGDIAPGPLNWCSDVSGFALPNSNLIVNISTMYWMTGHATDGRGYYPPDVYLPLSFRDYASLKDKPLEAILGGRAMPLKDILLRDGWEAFAAEFKARKERCPEWRKWFPYTLADLGLFAYFQLQPAGKKREALELLKLGAEIYPDDPLAWESLAEASLEQGDSERAIGCYERLLALEPGLAEARDTYFGLRLEKALRESGPSGAAVLFKELKKRRPGALTEEILNVLGYRLLRQDQAAAALEAFKLNVRLHPGFANGWDSLGEACLKAGDKEGARAAYRKALQIDPEMSSAREALARLLEAK